jgi:radical SAM protein with 4Fe4S-binding SPASM domain
MAEKADEPLLNMRVTCAIKGSAVKGTVGKIRHGLKRVGNNLLKPHRVLNYLGNKFVNPRSSRHMLFQPHTIDLEPTTKCNLQCVFCQVPGWERSKLDDMSLQSFKRIVRQFPYLNCVKIQGMGEPFLNRELFDMVAYCNVKGIATYINNNGTALDRERIERLFRSPPARLSFSLDTPDRQTYKALRGRDYFDRVVENISLAVKEKGRTGANTDIRIWCVLNSSNVDQMGELVRLARSLGVDNLSIQTRLGSFGKSDIRERNESIRVDMFDRRSISMLKEAERLAGALGLDFEIYTGSYYSENRPCDWVKASVYISVEGEVLPCCVIGDPRIVTMGNIFDRGGFRRIWNSRRYKRLREAIGRNRLPSFCENCYIGNSSLKELESLF